MALKEQREVVGVTELYSKDSCVFSRSELGIDPK